MTKLKTSISLVINLCVTAAAGFVIYKSAVESGETGLGLLKLFKYFSIDASIFALIASAVTAAFDLRILAGKSSRLPHRVEIFKYIAAVLSTLTILVAAVTLAPYRGFAATFSGIGLLMYLLIPLGTLLSFALFEKYSLILFMETLIALLPVVIYVSSDLAAVAFLKMRSSFYSFDNQTQWLPNMIIILSVSFIVCLLVRLLHDTGLKKHRMR